MNNSIAVKIKFLPNSEPGSSSLEYATPGSAGVDLQAWISDPEIILGPGKRYAFPTGVAMEITEPGVAGFVFSRSGLGTRQGLVVSQGVGVIDPDYRGEIIVSLLNTSGEEKTVTRGQRIAQLVFMPWFKARFQEVPKLSGTGRGAGGFGHSGK
ncbi:dUTP diphosphatase [Desulfonatronospira sp.]|uniref:dUTP diphosphatase n=1 Tax=Desulfonatronospira sp. TaxID=1962951 RepID=UPI0025BF2B99|nr:dUTP diphosphatase [Desulfonatronospira sp.]